jgi:hypothetical protein
MKNLILLAAAAAMFLSLRGTLFAADIDNLSGQSCGDLSGDWHFVNNQIPRGTGECSLLAVWSTGDMCDVGPTTVNKKTQHFNCVASGELLSATTGDCPGKLVLSDFDCDSKEPALRARSQDE